jgi:hypothetical protein
MATNTTGAVFRWMLREEWRLHAYLFGGTRFGAFPALVAVLAAGTAEFLTFAGTPFGAVVAGIHGLVFAFGLHTGSVGLVGRDAQRNLLPTGTLLVFSARTLPLSRRRLVGVFLLKDAVFYVGLFLLPMTVGFVPSVLAGRLPAGSLPLLWVSVGATFLLGTAVTFAAIALSTRGLSGWLVVVAVVGAAGLLWATADLVALTPYAIYVGEGLVRVTGAVGSTVLTLGLLGGGLAVYDPSNERPARTAANDFGAWHDRLPFDDGLLTKTVLDVSRSSGGLWKLLFSGGILFAVSAFLIDFAGNLTGVPPSTGVSFGAILGLTAFTTYNWLTSVDAPEDYLPYPVDVADVFRAKFRAFSLLGPPVGLCYFAVAAVWLGVSPAEALVGVALLVGLTFYLFGVTVYLAGFSPNEFLFDAVLFGAFFLAVAGVTVPVLVVGFVLPEIPPAFLLALAVAGVGLAGTGYGLYRRAVPRWTRKLRRGV